MQTHIQIVRGSWDVRREMGWGVGATALSGHTRKEFDLPHLRRAACECSQLLLYHSIAQTVQEEREGVSGRIAGGPDCSASTHPAFVVVAF